MERRRGRPRSTTWIGKFGEFVNEFTAERIAGEIEVDISTVYCWARGDQRPGIPIAIALVEIARVAGRDLSLEDIYEGDIRRVRARLRANLLPTL